MGHFVIAWGAQDDELAPDISYTLKRADFSCYDTMRVNP